MRNNLTIIAFFISLSVLSQSTRLEVLEKEREGIERYIGILQDSLSAVETNIANLKSEDILKLTPKKPVRATVKKGAHIMNKPKVYGNSLKKLYYDTEVDVKGFIDNFFEVSTINVDGYIHKSFFLNIQSLDTIIKVSLENKRLDLLKVKEKNDELRQREAAVLDSMITDLGIIARTHKYPSSQSHHLENFNKQNVKVIGFRNKFYKVKAINGDVGYVRDYNINDPRGLFYERLEEGALSRAMKQNENIFIRGAAVTNINSAGGVEVAVDWLYKNTERKLKYIYFSLLPYNDVGDVQNSEVGAHSVFIGQITGPISGEMKFRNSIWENAWYNSSISCLKIVKVKVVYMDGSTHSYVTELPNIIDSETNNNCKY